MLLVHIAYKAMFPVDLSTASSVVHGGTLVESILFNRRVVGSNPAVAAM